MCIRSPHPLGLGLALPFHAVRACVCGASWSCHGARLGGVKGLVKTGKIYVLRRVKFDCPHLSRGKSRRHGRSPAAAGADVPRQWSFNGLELVL